MMQKMVLRSVVVSFLLLTLVDAVGQSLGCYDTLPDGFTSQGDYSWQSSQYCSEQCSGSNYFALFDGNVCYCGSSAPSGSTSSGCTVSCVGYPEELCGGTSAYNIYAQDNVVVSSNTDTTSTSSTSSSSSTSTSTDVTITDTTSTSSSTTSNDTQETLTTTSTGSDTTTSSSTSEITATTAETTTTSTGTRKTTSSPATSTTEATENIVTSKLTTIIENSSSIVTSIVYVTQSVTPTASSSSGSSNSTDSNKSSSGSGSSKGAIIGGVVGGVLGAILIGVAIAFLWRRRASRDEYVDAESMMADDEAYEAALKTNPFASSEDAEAETMMLGRRRLSEGSLADAADYGVKVLRVANPDDDD